MAPPVALGRNINHHQQPLKPIETTDNGCCQATSKGIGKQRGKVAKELEILHFISTKADESSLVISSSKEENF